MRMKTSALFHIWFARCMEIKVAVKICFSIFIHRLIENLLATKNMRTPSIFYFSFPSKNAKYCEDAGFFKAHIFFN